MCWPSNSAMWNVIASARRDYSTTSTIPSRVTVAAMGGKAYAARIGGFNAQRTHLYGGREPPGLRWGRGAAERFRDDLHRSLGSSLEIIAFYIQPEDVLIDVGGCLCGHGGKFSRRSLRQRGVGPIRISSR